MTGLLMNRLLMPIEPGGLIWRWVFSWPVGIPIAIIVLGALAEGAIRDSPLHRRLRWPRPRGEPEGRGVWVGQRYDPTPPGPGGES
jgi:hypothetical protein